MPTSADREEKIERTREEFSEGTNLLSRKLDGRVGRKGLSAIEEVSSRKFGVREEGMARHQDSLMKNDLMRSLSAPAEIHRAINLREKEVTGRRDAIPSLQFREKGKRRGQGWGGKNGVNTKGSPPDSIREGKKA